MTPPPITASDKKNKPAEGTAAGTNPMWGGQFSSGPAEIMAQINTSLGFDRKLFRQDIAGSMAHATMLGAVGILSQDEVVEITSGLRRIEQEVEDGLFPFNDALEDIHMNIEARLETLIGKTAGKLHTARSRNDQVALDFRLYARNAADDMAAVLRNLIAALVDKAEATASFIMPGFTHMQPAQPVTLGHHLLAYVEMFGRDKDRVLTLRTRMNECPLGAAALAGSSFPIDRHHTASALGFSGPCTNSMDAVSSRDFALDFMSAAAISAVHLSRLAEECVLWSSPAYGFVSFSDLYTSGSSIMPQKRNPDAAELVRGKAGRITGALQTLLVTMKGLPLAYNKDMQEDKEPFFDAFEQWRICVLAMTGMVEDMKPHPEQMYKAASQGYSTATDLADWLVRTLKIPFRKAHHITARIVKSASESQCMLHELSLTDMQAVEPSITKEIYDVLSVEASVSSRTSFGGTAPILVKHAATEARKRWL